MGTNQLNVVSLVAIAQQCIDLHQVTCGSMRSIHQFYLYLSYLRQLTYLRIIDEESDALVPMLKELITRAGAAGTKEVVMGMAHRGRLNVLVNVMGKNPSKLFDEFGGKHDEALGSGDVKYHQGYSSDFVTPGGNVHLALAFNPSHLVTC